MNHKLNLFIISVIIGIVIPSSYVTYIHLTKKDTDEDNSNKQNIYMGYFVFSLIVYSVYVYIASNRRRNPVNNDIILEAA
jgi:hypothetical protein